MTNLSNEEISRWMALIEGVQLIEEAAVKKKIDIDRDPSYLKPLALQKYIDERSPALIKEIEYEQMKTVS
jgi:type VI protein secretion system component Hcp